LNDNNDIIELKAFQWYLPLFTASNFQIPPENDHQRSDFNENNDTIESRFGRGHRLRVIFEMKCQISSQSFLRLCWNRFSVHLSRIGAAEGER
jgi:hypothetical protein